MRPIEELLTQLFKKHPQVALKIILIWLSDSSNIQTEKNSIIKALKSIILNPTLKKEFGKYALQLPTFPLLVETIFHYEKIDTFSRNHSWIEGIVDTLFSDSKFIQLIQSNFNAVIELAKAKQIKEKRASFFLGADGFETTPGNEKNIGENLFALAEQFKQSFKIILENTTQWPLETRIVIKLAREKINKKISAPQEQRRALLGFVANRFIVPALQSGKEEDIWSYRILATAVQSLSTCESKKNINSGAVPKPILEAVYDDGDTGLRKTIYDAIVKLNTFESSPITSPEQEQKQKIDLVLYQQEVTDAQILIDEYLKKEFKFITDTTVKKLKELEAKIPTQQLTLEIAIHLANIKKRHTTEKISDETTAKIKSLIAKSPEQRTLSENDAVKQATAIYPHALTKEIDTLHKDLNQLIKEKSTLESILSEGSQLNKIQEIALSKDLTAQIEPGAKPTEPKQTVENNTQETTNHTRTRSRTTITPPSNFFIPSSKEETTTAAAASAATLTEDAKPTKRERSRSTLKTAENQPSSNTQPPKLTKEDRTTSQKLFHWLEKKVSGDKKKPANGSAATTSLVQEPKPALATKNKDHTTPNAAPK